MAYGEVVIDGTIVSSGVLAGQEYAPIATVNVEAEKIPDGEAATVFDENFQVIATIPAGDYWMRTLPDGTPQHMTAADFESQYRPV